MRVSAFRNASNKETYAVSKNGKLFDLTTAGVTKVEVVVVAGKVISSDTDDVTYSGSSLTIEWGALALTGGNFSPTIYAYKAGDKKGEVLFAPTQSPIMLSVIPDSRQQT